jgi:hypothetical protein
MDSKLFLPIVLYFLQQNFTCAGMENFQVNEKKTLTKSTGKLSWQHMLWTKKEEKLICINTSEKKYRKKSITEELNTKMICL